MHWSCEIIAPDIKNEMNASKGMGAQVIPRSRVEAIKVAIRA
ncbi:hypothetical protein RLEG3_06645 (plasmid) [Rhizobium leguminosarum bv. trifolii WSM1689]|nr:hypothetical protein RLEG3_06645 [Rhizobium leguminosarum bv. trifolii WSM1689]